MAAFKKAFSQRQFMPAVLFVAFLYLFEELIFDSPQAMFLKYGTEFYSPVELFMVYLSSIGSFLICYFFVRGALRSSAKLKVIYVFLFTFSSIVQYGYWKAVQRFLVSADLRIAAATPFNMWTASGVLFFNWRFILPVIAFIFWLLLFSKIQESKTNFRTLVILFLLMVILNFFYTVTDKTLSLGPSFSSFYQTATRFLIDSAFPSKRELISYQDSNIPQNNIVLVIDESIRGDHLSINGYTRETTPFLDELADLDDRFHNLGLAVAGASCSYPSNALILTGVRPGIDEFEMTMDYPTVFQYAKAMGYKTFYMDVQSSALWNGLTDQDLAFIDVWLDAPDFGKDFDSDFRAADRIAEIVQEGTGNFIVLNKRGVHFLYKNNYPAHATIWAPIPADYAADAGLISNPYDNAILYNVNTFFQRLLVNPEILENTTILYTSDHGQTLFENQESWLHCKYSPKEAVVPLILIGRYEAPINYGDQFSHSNLFPTMLDLMNVPAAQRIHPYASSLFLEAKDSATDHFFFDGSLRLIDFPDP